MKLTVEACVTAPLLSMVAQDTWIVEALLWWKDNVVTLATRVALNVTVYAN